MLGLEDVGSRRLVGWPENSGKRRNFLFLYKSEVHVFVFFLRNVMNLPTSLPKKPEGSLLGQ